MAEVLLFHHALGRTPGCVAFADDLRAAGHVVHLPDLYEGKSFDTFEDGIGHAESITFDTIVERARLAAVDLPGTLVYVGLSLGAVPAQHLAQTRGGARGAVLIHGSVPLVQVGRPWPPGLPLHLHVMDADAWGDVEVARDLADTIESAELYLYPGDRHLFTDRGLPDHDEQAAALVTRRVLALLGTLG